MAITNYDGIIAARAAGKGDDRFFQKATVASTVTAAGFWVSYLKAGGSPASAVYAAASAGGNIMTATSAGAIPLNNATAGDSKYLLTFAGGAAGAQITVIGLVDVLWAGGAVQMNSSATVTVNSSALTRSTDGKFTHLGVMTATALTTAATVTIWYTDAGDTATSIAVTVPVGAAARLSPSGYMSVPIPNGIKSIQSCQVQTAQTAGAVDLHIFRPLDFIPTVSANNWVERDMTAQIDAIMPLPMDSSQTCGCIAAVALQGGTVNQAINGMIRTVAG